MTRQEFMAELPTKLDLLVVGQSTDGLMATLHNEFDDIHARLDKSVFLVGVVIVFEAIAIVMFSAVAVRLFRMAGLTP